MQTCVRLRSPPYGNYINNTICQKHHKGQNCMHFSATHILTHQSFLEWVCKMFWKYNCNIPAHLPGTRTTHWRHYISGIVQYNSANWHTCLPLWHLCASKNFGRKPCDSWRCPSYFGSRGRCGHCQTVCDIVIPPPTELQKLQEKVVYFIKIYHVLQTVCDVFLKKPTSVINCLLLLNKKGPQNNQGPFFDKQIYYPIAPIYYLLYQLATLKTNTLFAHRSWGKPNIVFRHTLHSKLHHNLGTCSSYLGCHFDTANTSL